MYLHNIINTLFFLWTSSVNCWHLWQIPTRHDIFLIEYFFKDDFSSLNCCQSSAAVLFHLRENILVEACICAGEAHGNLPLASLTSWGAKLLSGTFRVLFWLPDARRSQVRAGIELLAPPPYLSERTSSTGCCQLPFSCSSQASFISSPDSP